MLTSKVGGGLIDSCAPQRGHWKALGHGQERIASMLGAEQRSNAYSSLELPPPPFLDSITTIKNPPPAGGGFLIYRLI